MLAAGPSLGRQKSLNSQESFAFTSAAWSNGKRKGGGSAEAKGAGRMSSDMVVALGAAAVRGETIVGLTPHPATGSVYLQRAAAASHAGDEVLRCRNFVIPQVRQTCAVVGVAVPGSWGF